tara:strand:+ start:487 stop:705 length:219 start_codon:yes stop_codon:yes gene_type:complete
MHFEIYFRKFLDMSELELKTNVNKLSRNEIIEWLSWNDKNGIYRDNDSMNELGNVLGLEEAKEIMLRQILDT